MKKHLIGRLLAGSLVLALAMPQTVVYADSHKVVTLGADLSEEQKVAVLKYFGVYGQNIETLYITNQDERNHLSSYVPLEQIGTKTFSCALVCPTNSGGIHVKTANLNWVTSNMIASTLSTSGVVNCDVLAASPFEVSGTGALTGIMMAYESASGTTLDEEKKEIATQELVTTGTIANSIGQSQATEIVNEIKIQIIQGQVVNQDEVDGIVYSVVEDVTDTGNGGDTGLTDEDYAMLSDLANQIAQQEYDYAEMEETLERVEQNVEGSNETVSEFQAETEDAEDLPQETLSEDSILMQTDDTALGTDVIIDATNEEALAETPEYTEDGMEQSDFGFDISSSDDYGEEDDNELSGFDDTQEEYPEEYPTDENTPSEQTWDELQQSGDEGFDGGEEFSDELTEGTLLLGRTEFSPDENDNPDAVTGTQIITFYIENSDLMLQDGELTVYDGMQTQIASVDLTDAQHTAVTPTDYDTLVRLGWNEGTTVSVVINSMLEPMQQYTVQIHGTAVSTWDQSTAQFEDSTVLFTGTSGIHFNVSSVDELHTGRSIIGDVLFDLSQAASAQISTFDDTRIAIDNTWFDAETSSFTATLLQAGEASIVVDFYDADGNYLSTSNVTLTILD